MGPAARALAAQQAQRGRHLAVVTQPADGSAEEKAHEAGKAAAAQAASAATAALAEGGAAAPSAEEQPRACGAAAASGCRQQAAIMQRLHPTACLLQQLRGGAAWAGPGRPQHGRGLPAGWRKELPCPPPAAVVVACPGSPTPTYVEGSRGGGRQAAREEDAAAESDEDLVDPAFLTPLELVVAFAAAACELHPAYRDAAREDAWAHAVCRVDAWLEVALPQLTTEQQHHLAHGALCAIRACRAQCSAHVTPAAQHGLRPDDQCITYMHMDQRIAWQDECAEARSYVPSQALPDVWDVLAQTADGSCRNSASARVVLSAAFRGLHLLRDAHSQLVVQLPGGVEPDPFLCGALWVVYDSYLRAALYDGGLVPHQLYAALSVLLLSPHPEWVAAGDSASPEAPLLEFQFSLSQLVRARDALLHRYRVSAALARATCAASEAPGWDLGAPSGSASPASACQDACLAAVLLERQLAAKVAGPQCVHAPPESAAVECALLQCLLRAAPARSASGLAAQLPAGKRLGRRMREWLPFLCEYGLVTAWHFGDADVQAMRHTVQRIVRAAQDVGAAMRGPLRAELQEVVRHRAQWQPLVYALPLEALVAGGPAQRLLRCPYDWGGLDTARALAAESLAGPDFLEAHPHTWRKLLLALDAGYDCTVGVNGDLNKVARLALTGLALLQPLALEPQHLQLSAAFMLGLEFFVLTEAWNEGRLVLRHSDPVEPGIALAAKCLPRAVQLLSLPVAAALLHPPGATVQLCEDAVQKQLVSVADMGRRWGCLPAILSLHYVSTHLLREHRQRGWPWPHCAVQLEYEAAIAAMGDGGALIDAAASTHGELASAPLWPSSSVAMNAHEGGAVGQHGPMPGKTASLAQPPLWTPPFKAAHEADVVHRVTKTLLRCKQDAYADPEQAARLVVQRAPGALVGAGVTALALLPLSHFHPHGSIMDVVLLQPACSEELYAAHGVAWPAQADVYQPPRDTDAVVAVPAFAGMRPKKDRAEFKDLYDWPKIHSSAVSMTAKTKWGDARRGVKRVLFEQKLRVCRVEARGVEGVQRALLLAAEVLADMRAEGRELVVAVAEYDEKGIRNAEAPQHKDEPHDAPGRPSNIISAADRACTNLLLHGPPKDVERELLAPVAAALRELGTPGSPAAEALVVVLHLAEVEHGRPQQLIPGRKPVEPRTDKQRQLLEKKKLADVLFLAQQ